MTTRPRGRPQTVDQRSLLERADELYTLFRGLPPSPKGVLLKGVAAEITELYPPDCYVARKFRTGMFPSELACEARHHRDYPQYDTEGQLRFIARYISGDGMSSPEYALKITRTLFSDKKRTRS